MNEKEAEILPVSAFFISAISTKKFLDMIRQLTILCFSVLCLFTMEAQTIDDAIRYGKLSRSGSARGMGMGGALGAIGGDFGALSTNPAGIGMYKWNEVELSPGLLLNSTSSELLNSQGGATDETQFRFVVPAASYVYVKKLQSSRWTRRTLAVGVARVADYNSAFTFNGRQDNSITNYFIDRSNFVNPDNLNASSPYVGLPAFDAFITTFDINTSTYFADIDAGEVVNKNQTIVEKGGMDEISLTVGADYMNKLQLGASLSLPVLNFNQKKEYTETLDGHPIFRQLEFDENLSAQGTGVNIKLGGKYIFARKIHVSAAFHTPTWMRISEEFDNRANYTYVFSELFPNPGPQEGLSPLGAFEYQYRGPWRAIGGLGVIIGRAGVITAEAEFVNHKSSRFTITDDPGYEELLNREIDQRLGSALSVRTGIELRPAEKLRIRGGVGLGQSIFADADDIDLQYWTLGVGVWLSNSFFIDGAFRHEQIDQLYNPYELNNATPEIASDIGRNALVFTVGYRFF